MREAARKCGLESAQIVRDDASRNRVDRMMVIIRAAPGPLEAQAAAEAAFKDYLASFETDAPAAPTQEDADEKRSDSKRARS